MFQIYIVTQIDDRIDECVPASNSCLSPTWMYDTRSTKDQDDETGCSTFSPFSLSILMVR